ncbi:hypothetical protein [Cochleicola gelatinilyticus]|uniref:Uncharacterized protein n=1 Tax=Cochleicola gelatinilyticus TaxID=1763537 RepID=A0A167EM70_9FLAO|nr:hypothetical protein [Cochleicola gelatinilyticus]OAB75674.1 hypothetical protein ULVI_14430 [Cochleicola gelatinilyticus]
MEKETNWIIRNLLWIFLIALIGLFSLQWYSLNENINTVKTEAKKQLIRLENSKTNLIQLEDIERDSLNYIFNATDIVKINKNLDALASEIYQERNKAEAIIDKDIDRLNLYMAIGIGFLALLGVFIPILVNILSNDDLKKKQKVLGEKLLKIVDKVKDLDKEELKQAIINANQAIEKSKEIEELRTKTDDILPKLSVISLQIAIHRLFNQSSLALNDSKDETNELFVGLFSDIKLQLEKCKNDSLLLIQDNPNLYQTIVDLTKLLDDSSFKYTSYIYSREIENKAENTISSLVTLSKSTESNQEENYKKTFGTLDALINEIKDTDA